MIQEAARNAVGGDATPLDELRAFGRAHVEHAVGRPSGQLIIGNLDYFASHDATAELMHAHEEVARDIMRRAVVAGQLREVHAVVAGATFFGALNTLSRTFDPDGDATLQELIDGTLDLLIGGWAPR